MPDFRFDEEVHCASCGYNTGVTRTQLFEKMNFNCPRCHFPVKRSDPNEKPKTEEPQKTCPFRFIGYKFQPQGSGMSCVKENCGVWSTEHNCCGFAAISKEGWSR